jgi:hypothetical protein
MPSSQVRTLDSMLTAIANTRRASRDLPLRCMGCTSCRRLQQAAST